MTNKGMKYINNGVIQKMIKPIEKLPIGFQFGKLPVSDETRKILSDSHKGKKLTATTILKRQLTFRQRYGVNSCSQLDGVGEKISQKLASKETQDKMKQTCLTRYGVENILQNKQFQLKMRMTNELRNGDKNYNNKEKEYQTRLINNTLGLFETKPEKQLYDLLIDCYGIDNVMKQYRSAQYPFKADFYLKNLDCYIEYNGYWTHNNHPFDKTNEGDLQTLSEWSDRKYDNAIYTWTDLDVRKRSYADKVNLIIFYPNEDDDIVYSFKKLKAEIDKISCNK